MKQIIVLVAAFLGGYVFNLMHVPAGWLLGAMLVGAFYQLFIHDISFPPILFDLALTIIGVSISLSINLSMFKDVASYLLPFFISLVLMFVASWFLGKFLERYSTLDAKTALFCCIPGGTSVMIALSRDYDANVSMVAAFQSVRIMVLVATIPIIAGFISPLLDTAKVQNGSIESTAHSTIPMWGAILFYALIIVLALALASKWRLPIAPFLYSIVLGFLFHTFIQPLPSMPNILVGVGLVLLGVIIGSRFDRKSLSDFKSVGWQSLVILLAFFLLTFLSTFVFFLMTPVDFTTSLLAVVPAGAPQMASVAALLNLDASIVAAMQVLRLLFIILFIPMVTPFLVKEKVGKSRS